MAPKKKASAAASKASSAKTKALPASAVSSSKKKVAKKDAPREQVIAEAPISAKKRKASPIEAPPAKRSTRHSTRKELDATTNSASKVETPKKKLATTNTPKSTAKRNSASIGIPKVIIIEASKECNSFKVTATKVEKGLKTAVPGVEIRINPDKPRKGCFEIRDASGTVFVSLQKMPRPFSKMKNLDLDKTVQEITGKIM